MMVIIKRFTCVIIDDGIMDYYQKSAHQIWLLQTGIEKKMMIIMKIMTTVTFIMIILLSYHQAGVI